MRRIEIFRLAGLVAVALLIPPLIALAGIPAGFLVGWLVATPLVFVIASRARSRVVRAVGSLSFGLLLALLVCEAAFGLAHWRDRSSRIVTRSNFRNADYFAFDPNLGYVLRPGIRVATRATVGSQTIYDAIYTVSANGHRSTKGKETGETWVFMGCSFTFGEGVNDEETLPSYFSALLAHDANVVNLGVRGYGPHQMLRALETERLPSVHHPVKQVIYQGMLGHVYRSAGRSDWDPSGPEYALSDDTVTYDGPFHGRVTGRLLLHALRSHLVAALAHRLYYDRDVTDHEIEIYARVIERSARLARHKLGAGFTIVFWDQGFVESQRVLARLQRTGIPIVKVSDVFTPTPTFPVGIPVDGHPTPEAYSRLANALTQSLGTE